MVTPFIADADRRIVYSPVASAGPFSVPFPLFDGTGADLYVTLDDVEVAGWTLSTGIEPGFYGAPNTFTNGALTFSELITGELAIEGRRSPRRESQYAEGRGIPARDHNTEYNILTAIARELWLRCGRIEGRLRDLAAELAGYLATIVAYIAQAAGFATAASQSADKSESWAEQPYGEPVIGDASGRSSRHWSEVSLQFATETAALAGLVGALIYDFNLPGELVGDEDWNNPT